MASISDSKVQSKIQKFRAALDSLGDSLSQDMNPMCLKPDKLGLERGGDAASPRPSINESSEIEHLSQLLGAEKETSSTLRKRLAHKDKLISELSRTKDNLLSESDTLKSSLSTLQTEITSLHRILSTKDSEIASLRSTQDQENGYSKEVQDIKQKLAEIESQNTGVFTEVQRLRLLVRTKDEAILKLTEEKARVVKELNVYNKRISLIDKENKEMKDALNSINSNSSEELIQKLSELMNVKNPQEIYPQAVYLMQTHDQLAKSGELVHRISQLISELSPPNSFSGGLPTHPQIWTWLANLISQFMKYKQSSETKALYELSNLLNVPPTNIVKKVKYLLKNQC